MTGSWLGGLRVRLLLLVMLAVIPALGIILYSLAQQHRDALNVAEDKALDLAKEVSQQHEHYFSQAQHILLTLAITPQVRQRDAAGSAEMLSALLKQIPVLANLTACTPDGQVFASAVPMGEAVSFADRSWFRELVQTLKPVTSQLIIGRLTGKPSLVLGHAVLNMNGSLQAVLTASLDLSWLNQFIPTRTGLPANTTLTIFDRQGAILIRHPAPQGFVGGTMLEAPLVQTVLSQRDGTARLPGLAGGSRLYGFTPIHHEGEDTLFVCVGILEEEALAGAMQGLIRALLWLGLVAAVALATAWFVGGHLLVRPINTLVQASKRVAEGDMSARSGLPQGRDEVSQLARSFDAMAESLAWQYTELQQGMEDLSCGNRSLFMRSESNKAIIRVKDEAELMKEVCRIVVQRGGYKMAWVGLAQRDEGKTVLPVARWGEESGYVNGPAITWADGERGWDPTGTAIRTGKPVTSEEIANDPVFAPWREEALKQGFGSALALPLIDEGDVLGALTIYAGELQAFVDGASEAFHGDAVELLADLADDLAFGIMGLRARRELELTTEELRKHRDDLEGLVQERTAKLREEMERRKLAEEAAERLAAIVDSSHDAIIGKNLDGEITSWNRGAEQLYGYTAEEVLGRSIVMIIPPEKANEIPHILESAKSGKKVEHYETVCRRKDGALIDVSMTISPIRDLHGVVVGASSIARDITERKQVNEELKNAKTTAEAATRAKSEFLANMSHEIRTPMNAISGLSYLALNTDLTPKQRDYIEKIQTSGQNLLGIINDILDFSKIEAGKLAIENVGFSLDQVLNHLATLVGATAQKKGLELLFKVDPRLPLGLKGDPQRLGQVLINLANNAVKFTETGEVVVSVVLEEINDEQARIRFLVRDTGIGISPEQIEKLFQPFSQADTSITRKFGGTGLGLTISKRLVEMMGGEIWVESAPGVGSEFGFTVVLGLDDTKTKAALPLPPDLYGLKVLVVDDSGTSREILQDMLASMSFEVTLAASGQEGLARLEAADLGSPFDLVLLDWKMPGMDGLSTAERIKSHPSLTKKPAIILLAAFSSDVPKSRAEQIGLDGFLVKPASPSTLLDAIAIAFGNEPPSGRESSEMPSLRHLRPEVLQGAEVLLVEDNDINLLVAQEIMDGAGLTVAIARDGQQAVDAVRQYSFDVVLMDVQMPLMDGYTATRTIRQEERFADLPIIAMTANAMAGDREKALEAGMNEHVAKPIDPARLFSVLARWIKPGVRGLNLPAAPRAEIKAAPVSTLDQLPEFVEGINLRQGLKRLGGNAKLYRSLLVMVRDEYAGAGTEIWYQLERGQTEDAQRLAHSIKGVAANVGATSLSAAAAGVEAAIKAGDQAAWPDKLAAFYEALAIVVNGLQVLGGEATEASTPAPGAAASPEELARVLNELVPHLLSSKPKQCQNAMEQINLQAWPSELSIEKAELNKLVKNYQFKEASSLVEVLLASLKAEDGRD